jgi:hypothetical protein
MTSHTMQIIAPRPIQNPIRHIKEHDQILLKLLAQRAHAWRKQRGISRLIARIKIELWAWRETAREQKRLRTYDTPRKVE